MIEAVIEDGGWNTALPDIEALAAACQKAAAAGEAGLEREIALLLCDDETIRDLNQRFRGRDKPTNVLSFPSGEIDGFLGDIALARETCLREAAEKGLALRDHAAHLIIHGMLHLIGYDHETDDDAAVMERRETEILRSMGIADPYDPEGED
ncbi:rRNA maturation RNase YbeY [Hyphococcus sp.]|uniref:rRNA maturation RNase YbeY n=1 Tax=Hyphococcus sp. TaxID=2038636 RepID=UPI002083F781|nr:MAG: endoribonuclease YbeY [Marinicaulis sp.]